MFDKTTDGIGYWNETMPAFTSDLNALDPSGCPGSELVQDVNGNGVVEYSEEPYSFDCHYFSTGISSWVQLVADDQSRLFLVYSSYTEEYNDGNMNFWRLWIRSSLNNGQSWGQFYHLDANDTTSIFSDYAFPSCAANSDENLHLIFMADFAPGIYCDEDDCPPDENLIYYAEIPKDEIVGIDARKEDTSFEVSQNFPNPFSETSVIKVTLTEPSEICLDILNLVGQNVSESKKLTGKAGVNTMIIERKEIPAGVYFYKVETEQATITQKMIIE